MYSEGHITKIEHELVEESNDKTGKTRCLVTMRLEIIVQALSTSGRTLLKATVQTLHLGHGLQATITSMAL